MEKGNKFVKVATILRKEWFIGSRVVRNVLTTSDGWLKLALEMLVYRGGRVNISGCRFMTVRTKPIIVVKVLGVVVACKLRMVLLMLNLL